jgi:hypothetical protein
MFGLVNNCMCFLQNLLSLEPTCLGSLWDCRFAGRKKGEVVAEPFGCRIMAGTLIEDSTGDGRSSSTEELPSDQQSHSGDSLVEWRSSEQVENGTPSTSPAYSDSDDDDCGTL